MAHGGREDQTIETCLERTIPVVRSGGIRKHLMRYVPVAELAVDELTLWLGEEANRTRQEKGRSQRRDSQRRGVCASRDEHGSLWLERKPESSRGAVSEEEDRVESPALLMKELQKSGHVGPPLRKPLRRDQVEGGGDACRRLRAEAVDADAPVQAIARVEGRCLDFVAAGEGGEDVAALGRLGDREHPSH